MNHTPSPPGEQSAQLDSALQALLDTLLNGATPRDLPPALERDARFQRVLTGLTDLQQFALAVSADLQQARTRLEQRDVELSAVSADLQKEIARRRLIESALQETEQRYRQLVDLSPVAIAVLSKGRFVFVNPAAVRLLGERSAADLLRLPFLDFVHPDHRELVAQRQRAVLEQGSAAPLIEEKLIRRDGMVLDVEVAGMSLLYEGRRALQIVIHDITVRRGMEQALVERVCFEELLADLSAMFVNAPADDVPHAVEQGLRTLVEFLDVDRGALRRFAPADVSRSYLEGYYSRPGIPPADEVSDTGRLSWWNAKLSRGEMLVLEHLDDLPVEAAAEREQAAGGTYSSYLGIPLAVGGEIRYYLVFTCMQRTHAWPKDLLPRLKLVGEILADALARARVELVEREERALTEALRDTAAALNSSLNFDDVLERILSAAAQVVPHDTANIAMMNDAGEVQVVRAHGYAEHGLSEDAALAMRFTLAGTPTFQRMTETGEPLIIPDVWADPIWAQRPASTWVRSYAGVPIRAKGKVVGFLNLDSATPGFYTAAHVDRLRAFADQAATAVENARLYEQTRRDAETKAELLKEVNHRVKNNLIAIIGLLLAERDHLPLEERRVAAAALDDVTHRIEGLLAVHQMLSDARWAPLRLSGLAAQIIRAALDAAPLDRHVTVDVADSAIEVSPRQASNLALAFNELATNTIKHALQGRDTAHIAVRVAADGQFILCEYRDDGPGYPAEVLAGQRRNVGLYLIRQLATETLRGTLTLANDGGAVTTLRIKVEAKDLT